MKKDGKLIAKVLQHFVDSNLKSLENLPQNHVLPLFICYVKYVWNNNLPHPFNYNKFSYCMQSLCSSVAKIIQNRYTKAHNSGFSRNYNFNVRFQYVFFLCCMIFFLYFVFFCLLLKSMEGRRGLVFWCVCDDGAVVALPFAVFYYIYMFFPGKCCSACIYKH